MTAAWRRQPSEARASAVEKEVRLQHDHFTKRAVNSSSLLLFASRASCAAAQQ
eukprot:SAG31_NODE_12187_length_960_cov_1.440186_1_plen_52_part_10